MANGSKRKQALVHRRKFLAQSGQVGVGLIAAPLVLNLAGCGDDTDEGIVAGAGGRDAVPDSGSDRGADASATSDADDDAAIEERVPDAMADVAVVRNPDAIADGAVLLGLYEGDGQVAATAALEKLDFSYLRAGDSVLIKVASNSGHVHPAVTSPAGVRAVVAHLKELGAGRVIVADQAGVEWVRRSAIGRFSSTRERFTENGLIALEDDAELHFFDDQGFDEGYFEASLPEEHHWPRGARLANVVREVDHILYMPRLAQHTLAGITLAHKSAIGFLRDDSRHDLHRDAVDFYEKYTEVSYMPEIRSRFRGVISVCEKLLLHGGPDLGTVYEMSPTLVLASSSLANHDAVAASLVVTLGGMVPVQPGGMTYNQALASVFNNAFAGGVQVATGDAGSWVSGAPTSSYVAHAFAEGVTRDRALQRGWALSGGQPERIEVVSDGSPLEAAVAAGVQAHGEGLYVLA